MFGCAAYTSPCVALLLRAPPSLAHWVHELIFYFVQFDTGLRDAPPSSRAAFARALCARAYFYFGQFATGLRGAPPSSCAAIARALGARAYFKPWPVRCWPAWRSDLRAAIARAPGARAYFFFGQFAAGLRGAPTSSPAAFARALGSRAYFYLASSLLACVALRLLRKPPSFVHWVHELTSTPTLFGQLARFAIPAGLGAAVRTCRCSPQLRVCEQEFVLLVLSVYANARHTYVCPSTYFRLCYFECELALAFSVCAIHVAPACVCSYVSSFAVSCVS